MSEKIELPIKDIQDHLCDSQADSSFCIDQGDCLKCIFDAPLPEFKEYLLEQLDHIVDPNKKVEK